MKLSFSTLGCPRWTFKEVVATAKDLHMDGVEIRGIGDKINATEIPDFAPDRLGKTMEKLESTGLVIPSLTSGATLAARDRAQESFFEACDYIDLAERLGVKYVRVMGTGEPHITVGDFQLAAGLYRQLCEYGAKKGVTPLIETNGDLSSSRAMLSFLDRAGSDNCGVLWDIHHTVRFGSESPVETFAALGTYVKHVHLKDSVMRGSRVEYRMMGYGDIPVDDAVKLLYRAGYDGFFSLEWVKRWNPDLQEPGIVFAHYKSYMDQLLG